MKITVGINSNMLFDATLWIVLWIKDWVKSSTSNFPRTHCYLQVHPASFWVVSVEMCCATKNVATIWNFSNWAIFIPLPSSSLPKPLTPTNRTLHEHAHLLVYVQGSISMILLARSIQIQPAFVRTLTDTHMHPHIGNPNTATHINWDFMNLISSGYTCILHGLLPIHLKSNQTKKYIPSVELSLTRGFATTSWAPFKQTSNVGTHIQDLEKTYLTTRQGSHQC